MTEHVNIKYFRACSGGKTEIVTAFLDRGVEPDARDQYELTGLIRGRSQGQNRHR